MSKPKQRRRIVLPTLLATGLSVAAGVGGYLLYAPAGSNLSEAAQSDLDAGFETAQGNDTLGSVASAWKRDSLDSSAPSTVTPVSASMPVEPLPEVDTNSRYATAMLEGAGDMLPVPEMDTNAGERIASDEAPNASETVARGQSPESGLPFVEPLPVENPLRGAAEPFGAASPLPVGQNEPVEQSEAEAQQAFAQPAPMPVAEASTYRESVGPDPSAQDSSNPLRPAAIPPGPEAAAAFAGSSLDESAFGNPEPGLASQPEPAQFDDARPMAALQPTADQYADRQPTAPFEQQPFEPQPTAAALTASQPAAEPAATTPYMASSRELPNSEPAAYGAGDLAPIGTAEQRNAFNPMPAAVDVQSPAIDEGTGRPGDRALEGAQRPSLVLQKFAPEEIQVGKQCKFVIKVRNVGQRPADDVLVEDEIPQGARFVAAAPQATSSGSTLQWQLGTLSPGEERTLEVELMPTEEGEIGSVAQVTFASHASAKARCTRPQLALRMTAPSEVLIGRQQLLTIELHNPGTGDATGVMLLENVPENVRHQSGPALEFEVGTLKAGETRRMELVLTAEKPGRVVNKLTARADGNLQVQQEVEFDVISPAIAVGLQGPSRRYLERPATYTVSVDNPGTAAAKDVQLITKLPKGMRFVRANNMGEYDSASHSVYWSLAELPEGQKGSVELVAMPVQSGDHTIEVEGRAREGLEDRTTQAVRIEGLAAIMFEVSDVQDPIEVGGTTSYDIRVVNQGSKTATNVRVRALLPPGLVVTNAQSEVRHVVEADGVVFEPIARLAPKADTSFRIDVQGVQSGDQRFTVEVMTDDISQPIRKEESTRVFGDE